MVLFSLLAATAFASTPTGWVDVADGTHIAGWASDADYGGAIAVHVYVDGVLVRGVAADAYRADVGSHAFDWYHEPFGAGEHEVVMYAIGVDGTGALDGNNPSQYVGETYVRAGVNTSYGGTILQLYDEDWTDNLLMEHGGAAIFTNHDVDARFYWFDGDAPFAGANSAVASAVSPFNGVLAFPDVDPVTTLPTLGTTTERWWTACDASDDRCVTIATVDRTLTHASLSAEPGEGAYLTAMGNFNIYPGFDQTWSYVVFPYRYDTVVNGVSVRDVIFAYAAAAGCSAEVECNGVDEDCTGEDRCGSSGDEDTDAQPRGASRSPGPTGRAGALPALWLLPALWRRSRR